MALILDGTAGITSPGGDTSVSQTTTNISYSGTLTGGTGVVNLGSGQVYKDASGNVGIGTSSPTSYTKLTVSGAIQSIGSIGSTAATAGGIISNESPITRCYVGDGSGFSWAFSKRSSSTTSDLVTITDSGNVGIGTSSPTNALSVYRGAGVAAFIDLTGNGNTAGASNVVIGQNADDGGYFWNRKSSFLSFGTNNSERARIDSSGDLLVGTTSATAKFSISGVGGSNAQTLFANGWGSGIGAFATLKAANTSNADVIYFETSAAQVGKIAITSTATSYVTSSDYRLKENVAPMTGALAKVQALNPVTYTWKADGSAGQGFIAHELQEVCPDCVTGEKDAVQIVDDLDQDGKVIGTKEVPQYQGVDTSFLVGILTAAIKEQQTLITDLTTRLEALENK
jgi:hypothetical protein